MLLPFLVIEYVPHAAFGVGDDSNVRAMPGVFRPTGRVDFPKT